MFFVGSMNNVVFDSRDLPEGVLSQGGPTMLLD